MTHHSLPSEHVSRTDDRGRAAGLVRSAAARPRARVLEQPHAGAAGRRGRRGADLTDLFRLTAALEVEARRAVPRVDSTLADGRARFLTVMADDLRHESTPWRRASWR